MIPVDRIVRELKVSLQGFKKGITEIALDVNENMEIMKLTLQIAELEKKTGKAFTQLGQLTYQTDGNSLGELRSHPDVNNLLMEILDYKQQVSSVELQVESLRDDLLRERFSELRANLRRKGGMIEELVLLPGSIWVGKKVIDLRKDDQVILMALIREYEMIYPRGETVLKEGDRIYLIGPRERIHHVMESVQPQGAKIRPPAPSP